MYQRLFIGNKIIRLDEVDSTNNFLQKLISNKKDEIEGLVVVTKNQLAGKGLGKNRWISEKDKNLTFSILLKPNLLIQNQFLISKVISLSVVGFLKEFGLKNVKIKWPNDIYVGDKKIAGILIENSIRNSSIYNSVVGIGLNVNQINFDSGIKNPTSIIKETRKELLSLDKTLDQLLFFIEKKYLQFKSGKIEFIHQEYLNNLYWYNEMRNFKTKNDSFKGVIIGTNSIGKLKIKVLNNVQEFDLKEISFDIEN